MPLSTSDVVVRRARRIVGSMSLGLVSQVLTFVVGIVIIRSLSKLDYTAYSLSATITGAVVILADSGINSTLMAAAARAENSRRFRALFSAALRWRRLIWTAVILPALALLLYLLLLAGSPVLLSVLLTVLTGALSLNTLSLGLVNIDFQLSGQYRTVQGLGAINAAARVLLIGGAAVFGLSSVLYYLVIALSIGTAQRIVMTKRVHARHEDAPPTAADQRLFGRAVRSTIAVGAFIILGEQLVNVILVQRGNALAVADITALGRFAVAFSLPNAVMANLAAPLLARAGESRAGVARASGQVVFAYALACGAYVGGVMLFSPLLLQILGPQYDHLRTELLVVSIGAAVSNFASSGIGQVVHARGWVTHSWTYGLFLAVWILYAVFFANVSTTLGAATLSAALCVPLLLSNMVRLVGGFLSLRA